MRKLFDERINTDFSIVLARENLISVICNEIDSINDAYGTKHTSTELYSNIVYLLTEVGFYEFVGNSIDIYDSMANNYCELDYLCVNIVNGRYMLSQKHFEYLGEFVK